MVVDDSIARITLQQTGQFALMSAGAHNFQPLENGVRFDIHIIPRPDGVRPEIMHAEIVLEPTDLYRVTITQQAYLKATPSDDALYFHMDDLFFDKLGKVLIGLERGTLHGRQRPAHIPS